jgi:hypothetical protein
MSAPLTPEEIAKLPHDDRGSAILGVHWALTGLAMIFLALRIYCKRLTSRKLWWDDWILIAAYVRLSAFFRRGFWAGKTALTISR